MNTSAWWSAGHLRTDQVRRIDVEAGEIDVALSMPADAPPTEGHFPDAAIVPAVCLVELAHRVTRYAAPAAAEYLESVDRSRFHRPVYPNGELTIRARWTVEPPYVRCQTTFLTDDGPVADIRLTCSGGSTTFREIPTFRESTT